MSAADPDRLSRHDTSAAASCGGDTRAAAWGGGNTLYMMTVLHRSSVYFYPLITLQVTVL